MVYNDTTNDLGIIQACEDYCGLGLTGISGDADKLKEFTRYSNRASKQIWHWIFIAQGLWRYDDSNETDLPQGTTDLASGTDEYSIPFDVSDTTAQAITIQRVEIKDSSGDWVKLRQITEDQIDIAIDEYMDTAATPFEYMLLGNTLRLFPAPNYSSTGGLKVYFDRTSVDFTSTDTTESPGFASPYHDLVAIGASLEWLMAKRPDSRTLSILESKWQVGQENLSRFYSERNKDRKLVLHRKRYNSFK